MVKSFDALALLAFFLIIVIILFGALIYFCEAGLDNYNHELGGFARLDVTGTHYELSPFNSIPASFWWVLVTATTVGYGDMYPTSFEGKMIATLTMMVGVLALALPVSVIGANFADIYGKKQKQTLQAEQKMLVQMWKGQIGNVDGAEETRINTDGDIETIDTSNRDRIDSEESPDAMKDELLHILRDIQELSSKATLIMRSMDADEFKDTARKERRITELERQVTMMSKTKSKLGSFQALKRMGSKEKINSGNGKNNEERDATSTLPSPPPPPPPP